MILSPAIETIRLRMEQDPLFRAALAVEAKTCPELAALMARAVAGSGSDDQEQQRVGREDQEPHAQPAKPA